MHHRVELETQWALAPGKSQHARPNTDHAHLDDLHAPIVEAAINRAVYIEIANMGAKRCHAGILICR
ncbi:hypothetical protein GCM10027575_19570 [Phytohabitans suffuscus]